MVIYTQKANYILGNVQNTLVHFLHPLSPVPQRDGAIPAISGPRWATVRTSCATGSVSHQLLNDPFHTHSTISLDIWDIATCPNIQLILQSESLLLESIPRQEFTFTPTGKFEFLIGGSWSCRRTHRGTERTWNTAQDGPGPGLTLKSLVVT